MGKILVTGACGQVGSELTLALRERAGNENVVATGHKTEPGPTLRDSGPFAFVDVTRRETVEEVVDEYEIDTTDDLSPSFDDGAELDEDDAELVEGMEGEEEEEEDDDEEEEEEEKGEKDA